MILVPFLKFFVKSGRGLHQDSRNSFAVLYPVLFIFLYNRRQQGGVLKLMKNSPS